MYVAHNRLPIHGEDQRKMLEERFAKAGDHMKHVPGFAGFQLLRANDQSHFIVSTTWESKQYFEDWIQSPHFAAAHGGQSQPSGNAQVAAYEVVYNS